MSESKAYETMDELLNDNSTIEYKQIEGLNGRSVWIKSLLAEDMMEWSEANEKNEQKKREAGLRLIVKSMVRVTLDAAGNVATAVTVGSEEDIPKLRKMKAMVTEKVIKAILDFNNMTEKKDTAVKND